MIAMALACDPDVIIADEPTTALDVIVQGQILDLLKDKVRERGLTLLMISHDLSVLATTCERIAVMYKGELVEHGPSREVMEHPNPATAKLAAAFPVIGDPESRMRPRSPVTATSLRCAEAETDFADDGPKREVLLEADNLSVVLEHLEQAARYGPCNDVDLALHRGRDPRTRRPVRLRQVDARPGPACAAGHRRRRGALCGREAACWRP